MSAGEMGEEYDVHSFSKIARSTSKSAGRRRERLWLRRTLIKDRETARARACVRERKIHARGGRRVSIEGRRGREMERICEARWRRCRWRIGSQDSWRKRWDVRVREWRSAIDRKERMCRMTSSGRASILEAMSEKASPQKNSFKVSRWAFRCDQLGASARL